MPKVLSEPVLFMQAIWSREICAEKIEGNEDPYAEISYEKAAWQRG